MKLSACYERVVNVMETPMEFTLLTRGVVPYPVDRYSERKESSDELSSVERPLGWWASAARHVEENDAVARPTTRAAPT